MEKTQLVTAKEYIRRKRIARSSFFYRLKQGQVPYYQIKGRRKYFDLSDGLVWRSRKG